MTIQNGIYRLQNAKSGTYLDASLHRPNTVYGYNSHPEAKNQQWRVEESGGLYTFQNVNDNKFLSANGTNNGTNVGTSHEPKRWSLQQDGSSYVILAEHSQAAVDLDMGRDDNETDINLWHNSGAQQQRWRFEQVSGGYHQQAPHGYGGTTQSGIHPAGGYSGPLPPGPYFIHNVHTGTSLDLSGSKREDGTRIIGYQVTRGENQKWILESGHHGYSIRNSASGSYLGFGRQEQIQEGTLISGNSYAPEWDIRQSDQGYQIYLAESHLVLDLASGDATDGAKVCLWSNKNGANQKWRIDRA